MNSSSDLERYSRHLILKEIGGPGLKKLKNSSVLIIGLGGLGSPLLQYLCTSGIGSIGLVDFDKIELIPVFKEDENCSICLEPMANSIIKVKCGHCLSRININSISGNKNSKFWQECCNFNIFNIRL